MPTQSRTDRDHGPIRTPDGWMLGTGWGLSALGCLPPAAQRSRSRRTPPRRRWAHSLSKDTRYLYSVWGWGQPNSRIISARWRPRGWPQRISRSQCRHWAIITPRTIKHMHFPWSQIGHPAVKSDSAQSCRPPGHADGAWPSWPHSKLRWLFWIWKLQQLDTNCIQALRVLCDPGTLPRPLEVEVTICEVVLLAGTPTCCKISSFGVLRHLYRRMIALPPPPPRTHP